MSFDEPSVEQLHIKGLSIDWDKIEPRSYLREIGSISGIDHLEK